MLTSFAFLLPITYYLLPVTCYLLPVTCYLLPVSYRLKTVRLSAVAWVVSVRMSASSLAISV